MYTPAHFSQPIQVSSKLSDLATKPSASPSEMTAYRPDDAEGASYVKEDNKQPKGNEMPGIDDSTEEGEARNERIKSVHDPKSDDKDMDAYTKRGNKQKPA